MAYDHIVHAHISQSSKWPTMQTVVQCGGAISLKRGSFRENPTNFLDRLCTALYEGTCICVDHMTSRLRHNMLAHLRVHLHAGNTGSVLKVIVLNDTLFGHVRFCQTEVALLASGHLVT